MSVVISNRKKPLWPITVETDNPVSQSKLEAKLIRAKGMYERVTIDFDFQVTSDWTTKLLAFLFFEPIAFDPPMRTFLF